MPAAAIMPANGESYAKYWQICMRMKQCDKPLHGLNGWKDLHTCTAILIHEIVEVVGHDADDANLHTIFFNNDVFLIIDRKMI